MMRATSWTLVVVAACNTPPGPTPIDGPVVPSQDVHFTWRLLADGVPTTCLAAGGARVELFSFAGGNFNPAFDCEQLAGTASMPVSPEAFPDSAYLLTATLYDDRRRLLARDGLPAFRVGADPPPEMPITFDLDQNSGPGDPIDVSFTLDYGVVSTADDNCTTPGEGVVEQAIGIHDNPTGNQVVVAITGTDQHGAPIDSRTDIGARRACIERSISQHIMIPPGYYELQVRGFTSTGLCHELRADRRIPEDGTHFDFLIPRTCQ